MKLLKEILITFILALLIFACIRLTVQSFRVEGISMLPGIQDGQYILVNKATYFFREPQQGEVIVFRSPQQAKADLIKRVIALPGDKVEIVDGSVLVNGITLDEPYVSEAPLYSLTQTQVPEDNYFVLGDNRNHSQDSHTGWTVPHDYILGKAWITLWPPKQWGAIKHYPLTMANTPQQSVLYVAWQTHVR